MRMSTVIGPLSERFGRHPKTTRVALGLFLIALLAWAIIDTSDVLTDQQSLMVRNFVLRTHSDQVRDRFNETIKDGRLTVNETKSIIEVAKREESGYGLISDQKNNK